MVDEHNARMSLAYHIVALQQSKKLPKFETLMRPYPTYRRQTVEEQKRIMQMIANTFRS